MPGMGDFYMGRWGRLEAQGIMHKEETRPFPALFIKVSRFHPS